MSSEISLIKCIKATENLIKCIKATVGGRGKLQCFLIVFKKVVFSKVTFEERPEEAQAGEPAINKCPRVGVLEERQKGAIKPRRESRKMVSKWNQARDEWRTSHSCKGQVDHCKDFEFCTN